MTNDTEAYRHACEVRDIASRPLHQRRQYLTEVEAKRGNAAADALRAGLMALWRAQRAEGAT